MIDSHENNHAAGQSERHLNGVRAICTPLIYVGGAFLCVAVLMKEQRRYRAFKHSVNFPASSHEELKQFIDVAETLLQPSLFLGVGRGLHGHIFAANSATINSLRNFGKKIQSLFLAVNVDAEGIVKARDKTFTRNFIFIVNKHWFHKVSSFVGKFGNSTMDDGGRYGNVPPITDSNEESIGQIQFEQNTKAIREVHEAIARMEKTLASTLRQFSKLQSMKA